MPAPLAPAAALSVPPSSLLSSSFHCSLSACISRAKRLRCPILSPFPPSLYPGLHAQCQAHGHRIPPVRPRVPRARGVAPLALPSLALATPFHVGCWTKRRGRFFVILPLEGRCMLEFCGWDGIWATIQVRNSLLAFREKGNRQGRPRRSPAPAAATARDGMGGGGKREGTGVRACGLYAEKQRSASQPKSPVPHSLARLPSKTTAKAGDSEDVASPQTNSHFSPIPSVPRPSVESVPSPSFSPVFRSFSLAFPSLALARSFLPSLFLALCVLLFAVAFPTSLSLLPIPTMHTRARARWKTAFLRFQVHKSARKAFPEVAQEVISESGVVCP